MTPTRGRRLMVSLLDPANPRLVQIPGENISRGIILKIHSLCNLACSYCYMYDEEGSVWRERPSVMSNEVINKTAERVREYMDEHRLSNLSVILHGGEPLLAGIAKIRYIVTTFRAALSPGCTLHFAMQTNATLVTPKIAAELKRLGVRVGASLDGDETANGKRLYQSGRSSYEKTVRGIKLLKEQDILDRILIVVDPKTDPKKIAATILPLHPDVECLLPITSWETEPTERPVMTDESTAYAQWMLRFDIEWANSRAEGLGMRTAVAINRFVRAYLQGRSVPAHQRVEWVGPWCVGDLVVETDGAIELLDGLNMVHNGDSATAYNIFEHRLTHGLVALLEASAERGIIEGSPICQACPFFSVCGGGLYLHRFGPKNGYRNPSRYCTDLQRLFLEYGFIYWKYVVEVDETVRARVKYNSLEEAFGFTPTN